MTIFLCGFSNALWQHSVVSHLGWLINFGSTGSYPFFAQLKFQWAIHCFYKQAKLPAKYLLLLATIFGRSFVRFDIGVHNPVDILGGPKCIHYWAALGIHKCVVLVLKIISCPYYMHELSTKSTLFVVELRFADVATAYMAYIHLDIPYNECMYVIAKIQQNIP